jgi:hypothetical protein
MKKLLIMLLFPFILFAAEEDQTRIEVVKKITTQLTKSATVRPADSAGIFLISTKAELDWYRDTVNTLTNNNKAVSAKLIADIDYENGIWIPLSAGVGSPSFGGVFDGQGHTISNLKIDSDSLKNKNKSYQQNLGFVGPLKGTVKNLNLVNVYVKNTATGGTVPGAIDNSASGKEAKSISMGTIAGWVDPAGKIDSVSVSGEMWAYGDGQGVGGIAGNCHGKIMHSSSAVTIHVINLSFVGGITGLTKKTVTIDSVHWQGNIIIDNPEDSSQTYIGGIIGNVYEGTANITNATFDSETVQNSIGRVNKGTVNADILRYGVYSIETKNNKKIFILNGEYTGIVKDGVIVKQETVDSLVFERTFKPGIYSTIVLPFTIDTANVTGAKFYTLHNVVKDESGKWQVQIVENTAKELSSGMPYIVITSQPTIEFASGKYTVKPSNPIQVFDSAQTWSLNANYTFKYGSDFGDDRTNIYGFAANAVDTSGIKAGDFVRAGMKATIKPFRVYLHKETTKNTNALMKRAAMINKVNIDEADSSISVVIVSNEPQEETTRLFKKNPESRIHIFNRRNNIIIKEHNGLMFNIKGRRVH